MIVFKELYLKKMNLKKLYIFFKKVWFITVQNCGLLSKEDVFKETM